MMLEPKVPLQTVCRANPASLAVLASALHFRLSRHYYPLTAIRGFQGVKNHAINYLPLQQVIDCEIWPVNLTPIVCPARRHI
ncbi:hypothetical protein IWQ48_005683 [Labrenzia sp. EL_13]|nr:hypothetical protein [Labrenzia sp. EL_162]MBG6198037.1 hypothetical protein [Labrenzia sp. EL_159]MBG6204520.1 hypothetical protein [Labrenzia sp. EL_13]